MKLSSHISHWPLKYGKKCYTTNEFPNHRVTSQERGSDQISIIDLVCHIGQEKTRII